MNTTFLLHFFCVCVVIFSLDESGVRRVVLRPLSHHSFRNINGHRSSFFFNVASGRNQTGSLDRFTFINMIEIILRIRIFHWHCVLEMKIFFDYFLFILLSIVQNNFHFFKLKYKTISNLKHILINNFSPYVFLQYSVWLISFHWGFRCFTL